MNLLLHSLLFFLLSLYLIIVFLFYRPLIPQFTPSNKIDLLSGLVSCGT